MGDEPEVEGAEEEDDDLGNNVSIDVEITDVGSGPPPPAVKVFHPLLFKGKDELVLVTNNGIKNEKVATSLLDGIALAEDLKLYSCLNPS